MPLCTLELLSLQPQSSIPSFLSSLRSQNVKPILQSRVFRWIILPSLISTDALLAQNIRWDLLLIFNSATSPMPATLLDQHVAARWTVTAGVPSRVLASYRSKNADLLNPPAGMPQCPPLDMPARPRTAASAQGLELSPALLGYLGGLADRERAHPVSMLNLLAFAGGENGRAEYAKYGQAFAASAGKRHGGDAKIVGSVVSGQGKEDGWEEIAVAHYPSPLHFAAMVASEDYQKANVEHRMRSLRDTCILMTMEIGDDGELAGGRGRSRL